MYEIQNGKMFWESLLRELGEEGARDVAESYVDSPLDKGRIDYEEERQFRKELFNAMTK